MMTIVKSTKDFWILVLALLLALAMLAIAVALAGYGHGGWGWALMPSILGLAGFPLAVCAWTKPEERGRSRAATSLSLAIVADIMALPGFFLEWELLADAPVGSILWVALFVGWHAVAVARLSRLGGELNP